MKKVLILGGHPLDNQILEDSLAVNKEPKDIESLLFTSDVLDFVKSKSFDLLIANEDLMAGDSFDFLLKYLSEDQKQKTMIVSSCRGSIEEYKKQGINNFISIGNVPFSKIINCIDSEIKKVLK